MLRSLRTMARARDMRLAWRVAAGDADDEIPALIGRRASPWRKADSGHTDSTRRGACCPLAEQTGTS
jgi:hypothetical protein